MEDIIKLGLIKGRHELPVENYIVEESELNVFTKEELQPIVEKGIKKYLELYTLCTYAYEIVEPSVEWWNKDKKGISSYNIPTIQLYITGLTIVTLIAVEILINGGYDVEIMGFNPITKEYYSQGLFKKKDIEITYI